MVSSDKQIVVNSGSANGSFADGGARDYGIDQIVDLSKVGKEYIFVKGNGENSYENVLVVVHEDNTEIFVNGDSKVTRNAVHLLELVVFLIRTNDPWGHFCVEKYSDWS